jgi:hypothetical protein
MALTIEDGTGVADADSYATVAELDAFAAARGFSSLPATDADKEVLLRLAFDYVEAHRGQFLGTKANLGNEFAQWPREDVCLDGEDLAATEIPRELKRAQMQLAVDANDETLSPTGTGQAVIREKLDVLETEYAEGGSIAPQPIFAAANKFLAPLLKTGGLYGALGTTTRI